MTLLTKKIKNHLPNRQLVLGIDRLDYTKGIPLRLEAFRNLLARYPELKTKITFVQVVVPSRENIPKYFQLKTEIERLVGEINGQFTVSGWVPIHYIFRSLDRTELLAYYRASEIAYVTPLKDGMNLVAKEFCATSLEEDCVLILSEFAGAAAELQRSAILVNPFDIEGMADAIFQAYNMPKPEKRKRMKRMRRHIKEHDIFLWLDSFFDILCHKKLADFQMVEGYMPNV